MMNVVDIKSQLTGIPFNRIFVKAVVIVLHRAVMTSLLLLKNELMIERRIGTVMKCAAGRVGFVTPIFHDVDFALAWPIRRIGQ